MTSYAAGTRLPIETTGTTSLVQVVRVKLKRTAGTAASFTPRIYSTAAGAIGTVAQQFAGSSTVVADLFDVVASGVLFDTDAAGKLYLEPGPNAGADNAFDYEVVIEVL
ncbi:MAG: hypothetical protein JHD30_05680 [Chloroflexi bacterium]|nr:hypothetical protein [Chloroflexota bacterium]